ncbi:hypothetical protein CONLIGDRAFT_699015 [Coniochaeta ligniaria NRRL 30616]|uniref:DUF6546 domain-containing protein n=1 Tax=Coniochaeta ligniaria NRRL 30616 TaxID=1408157 RepID=A0A1J7IYG7_9PEZI|nr:hypothetical protein CONLIGDRAFT_699015 [Coniochaeta ligniaria NRRL 30616]
MSLLQSLSSTASWRKFPAEIRCMILEIVAESDDDRPNFPRYATVNKEFQSFFEPVCFDTLTFSNYERIQYVKTIALDYRIELRRGEIIANERHDMFFTMSAVLLRAIQMGTNPRGVGSAAERESGASDGEARTWAPFRADEAPMLDFDLIPCPLEMYESLPRVEAAVTSLAIRKHDGYQFSDSNTIISTLRPILDSLPKLQHFKHDYWRGVKKDPTPSERTRRATEYRSLVLDKLHVLESLRSVNIFEDFTCCFRDELPHIHHPQLGQALAQQSQHLEELHLSRNIDACDFFSAFVDNPASSSSPPADGSTGWPKMRHLSMTAFTLLDGDDLQPLLQAVAAAAETMPRLEALELWAVANHQGKNSERRKQAGVFRYDRLAEIPRLTLMTTCGASMDDETKAAWTRVAEKHDSRHSLVIETATMDAAEFRSHTDVMDLLVLKGRLLPDKEGSEPFLLCDRPRPLIEYDSRPSSSHSSTSSPPPSQTPTSSPPESN